MIWANLMVEIFVRKPLHIRGMTFRWFSNLIFEIAPSPLNQISLFLGLAGVIGFAADIWEYSKAHPANIILAFVLPSIMFIVGWSVHDLLVKRRKSHAIANEEDSRHTQMIHFLQHLEEQGEKMALTQKQLKSVVKMENDDEVLISLLDEARYLNLLSDNRGIYHIPDMFALRKHLKDLKSVRTG